MGIILCPYCGEHLKERQPVCPSCQRARSEGDAITDASSEHETGEPPQLLPTSRIARGWLGIDNRLPENLFTRAFLVGTGLAIVGGIGGLRINVENGAMMILVSPLIGLMAALFVLLGWNSLASLYEALAGPDPRQVVPPEARARIPGGLTCDIRAESIQPAAPRSSITDRAAWELPSPPERSEPASPSASRAPPKATPFWPVFILILAAVAVIGYFSGGTVGHAFLLGFVVGAPAAFVLGALSVRWSRGA